MLSDDHGGDEHARSTSTRDDQRLGVGAGGDDDVLTLVEELARDGHAPIMSPGRPRRTCTTSPAADRERPVVGADDQPAPARRRRAPGRGVRRPPGRCDVRPSGPSVHARRRRTPRRSALGVVEQRPARPCERARAPGRAGRSGRPARRSRARPTSRSATGSSSRVWSTLMPIADHRRRAVGRLDPLDQDARRPCARAVVDQHVVGPLQGDVGQPVAAARPGRRTR